MCVVSSCTPSGFSPFLFPLPVEQKFPSFLSCGHGKLDSALQALEALEMEEIVCFRKSNRPTNFVKGTDVRTVCGNSLVPGWTWSTSRHSGLDEMRYDEIWWVTQHWEISPCNSRRTYRCSHSLPCIYLYIFMYTSFSLFFHIQMQTKSVRLQQLEIFWKIAVWKYLLKPRYRGVMPNVLIEIVKANFTEEGIDTDIPQNHIDATVSANQGVHLQTWKTLKNPSKYIANTSYHTKQTLLKCSEAALWQHAGQSRQTLEYVSAPGIFLFYRDVTRTRTGWTRHCWIPFQTIPAIAFSRMTPAAVHPAKCASGSSPRHHELGLCRDRNGSGE